MKAYLAGPDVFLPNAADIGRRKKAICAEHGLVGLFPLDNEIAGSGADPRDHAYQIYLANCALMREADICLANMTAFRGPSADVGTAFEMGFMRALNKPVFAYAASAQPYIARVAAAGFSHSSEALDDRDGLQVENFDLPDNLMLLGAVRDAAAALVVADRGDRKDLAALDSFTDCVALAVGRR